MAREICQLVMADHQFADGVFLEPCLGELLDRKRWNTRVEFATALFEYLEIFHNRWRRHFSLGMMIPVEFEFHHGATGAG